MQRVLVVGGGTGGTIVANSIAHRMQKEGMIESVEITVVDSSEFHFYQPAFLLIPFGIMSKNEAMRPERSLLHDRVKLVRERARKIDLRERVVNTESRNLKYDYIVIATGAKPNYSEIPNLDKAGYDFFTLDSSLKLKEALARFQGGRIVVAVAGIPYKCPPSPLEFVFLSDSYFRKLGLRDKVKINYSFPLPRPFTIESISDKIQEMLEEKGIETTLMFNVESVDPERKVITSMEGESMKYDLAVLVPPHTGAEVIKESGIADRGGWIPTDRYTLRIKGFDDAFAIGDATDLPVSKAGAASEFQAEVVSANISNMISGYPANLRYDGKVMCFLVTGIGQATILMFDYEHPPVPMPESFAYYWLKIAYNKMYWAVTARRSLQSFGV